MAYIHLKQVSKVYKTKAGDFPALKQVDLQVEKGDFIGIIGKSGAGKSTLVNMLAGIDDVSAGEVYVGGEKLQGQTEDNLARWRGKNVGVVYQSFELLPQLSLLDNVMIPMSFSGFLGNGKRKARAMELLEQVEIAEHADKKPSAISGGQQQRVAIARALANDPDLIVADEPTGNLDSVTAGRIYQLFQKLAERGKTIVMVSHDPSIANRVDRVFQLVDGELQSNHWIPSLKNVLAWLSHKKEARIEQGIH